MKLKRAGIFTKIIIVVLVIYALVTLTSLYSQINGVEDDISILQGKIETQTAENLELKHVLANSDDPRTLEQIAREKLGLAYSDEQIFNVD